MTVTSDAACLTCPTVLLRACTVIALNAVREKGSPVRHVQDLTGRRLTMTFVISRRTFNVRISVSIFGIEIEISVQ